jgi:signal transduction histidine kinase/ActR/RegA family two-component response regulator
MSDMKPTRTELLKQCEALRRQVADLKAKRPDARSPGQTVQHHIPAPERSQPSAADIAFDELFDLEDIQQLQDEFSAATGVASIITGVDGTPVTRPSAFCCLCIDIIRKTEKGLCNCYKSDAALGQPNANGPSIQTCMSGGLWDAGAAITVGGRHIANWLIGQVRDESEDEDEMRGYAREIGADEESFIEAFRNVPAMSRDQFGKVAQVLFTLANQLSSAAYQNVELAKEMTERKRAAAQTRKLQERLTRAERLESLGLLAGGVAHDLNNVLGPMVVLADVIKDDINTLDPNDKETRLEIASSLDLIKSSAQRAAKFVKDLVGLSRRGQLDLDPLDILGLSCVQKSCPFLTDLRNQYPQVTIKHVLSSNPLILLGSEDHLTRVTQNLVLNAAQAITDCGTITIAAQVEDLPEDHLGYEPVPAGRYAVLSVSDTCKRIDPDDLGRIFEPYITKKMKTANGGSGLGLSVVHGIVEDHHGYIDVESQPGSGTTFRIYLPLHDDLLLSTAASGRGPIVGGAESILIVDDEPGQRYLVRRSLGKLGYTVTEAENGSLALELLTQHVEAGNKSSPFDLVILDMVMGDVLDGLDTLYAMRHLFPDQKVIMASGHSEDKRAAAAGDLGASWLAKPYEIGKLADAVRKRLSHNDARAVLSPRSPAPSP